jgi:hypothetical protein
VEEQHQVGTLAVLAHADRPCAGIRQGKRPQHAARGRAGDRLSRPSSAPLLLVSPGALRRGMCCLLVGGSPPGPPRTWWPRRPSSPSRPAIHRAGFASGCSRRVQLPPAAVSGRERSAGTSGQRRVRRPPRRVDSRVRGTDVHVREVGAGTPAPSVLAAFSFVAAPAEARTKESETPAARPAGTRARLPARVCTRATTRLAPRGTDQGYHQNGKASKATGRVWHKTCWARARRGATLDDSARGRPGPTWVAS